MELTRDQIKAILDTADGRGLDSSGRMTLPVSIAGHLCRLALLGLEREQEAKALMARAMRRDAAESDAINAAFGAFPDLEPEPERDERAERVGRAAILAVDNGWSAHEVYTEIVEAMEEP